MSRFIRLRGMGAVKDVRLRASEIVAVTSLAVSNGTAAAGAWVTVRGGNHDEHTWQVADTPDEVVAKMGEQ